MVAEPVASVAVEGKSGAAIITEALRTDERLLEPACCDLAGSGASSVTVEVSVTEPITISIDVEGAPKDIVDETIKYGAMTTMAPTPFGNAIVACKRLQLFAYL